MTIQKNLGHSPRKLRLVADMVRKMRPEQALVTLRFTNKAAAPTVAKAIKTVMANAAVTGQTGPLAFKTIEVNEGIKMRRFRSAARGRARPYKKKFSQIKIVLTDDLGVQNSELRAKNVKQDLVKQKDKSENVEAAELVNEITEQIREAEVKETKKGGKKK